MFSSMTPWLLQSLSECETSSEMIFPPALRFPFVFGTVGMGVFALIILALVKKTGLISFSLWWQASFPKSSDRMLEAFTQRSTLAFILGLVAAVLGVFLVLLLLQNPALALLGVLMLIGVSSMMVLGCGPVYRFTATRLFGESRTLKSVLLGGLCAETAFLAPLIGQILGLIMLFRGAGAVLLSLAKPAETLVDEEAPAPSAPARPSRKR